MASFGDTVLKPDRLDNKPEDLVILIWILVVLVTGFVSRGQDSVQ